MRTKTPERPASRADRGGGQNDGVGHSVGTDLGGDVGAGQKVVIGVLDDGGDFTDLTRAEGSDLRGQLVDDTFPLAAGDGIPGDVDGLADMDAAEVGLIDVDQGHGRGRDGRWRRRDRRG